MSGVCRGAGASTVQAGGGCSTVSARCWAEAPEAKMKAKAIKPIARTVPLKLSRAITRKANPQEALGERNVYQVPHLFTGGLCALAPAPERPRPRRTTRPCGGLTGEPPKRASGLTHGAR
jgi:hypothetical protein